MRKTILLLLVSLSLITAMAQNGYMHFKGTVGPYDITLKLKITYEGGSIVNGTWYNKLSGSYTYTKAGNTLYLKGTQNWGGINLEETTPKGKLSAEWWLDGNPDSSLTGEMTVKKDGKTYPVRLRRVK